MAPNSTAEKTWLERPRDREVSIGLLLLGGLVTVIAFFFAGIAGMAYRNSWVQDWAIMLMGLGPPLVYLVTLVVTIRYLRSRRRSWHVALASCLGPIGAWFLGLGVLITFTFIAVG